MMNGKKTYAVAALMLIHAVAGYLTGQQDLAQIGGSVNEVLTALGLATLRHGIGGGK
jgi:hypothetical protein